MSHSVLGTVGALLKSKFPDAGQRPTLLPEDSNLKPAMLTFFCIAQEPIHFLKTVKQRKRLKDPSYLSYVD